MALAPHTNGASLLTDADNPLREFVRAFGLLERVMHPYFHRFGITGSQWGMLRTLNRAEQAGEAGLRLTDLSDRLLVRPPSVTSAVGRLCRAGLISRERTAGDRRAWLVQLTPMGKGLVARVLKGHAAQLELLLAGLSGPQQDALFQLLRQWSGHLEKLAAAPVCEPVNGQAPAKTRRQRVKARGRLS